MSLSCGIIQEHGGTIRIESKVGEGATFIVELPAGAENVSTIAEAGAETSFAEQSQEGAGKKVLVIDDEESVLKLVSSSLKRRGFAVDTVSDGGAGLRSTEQTNYDMIVYDWKMPGLNGQQVFEKLRSVRPEIANRFLFMTGDVVNERTQQFLRESGALCIAKPFSLAELGATLKKMKEQIESSRGV